MIQLEQVRNLETKVKQAVELISRLKSENDYLKSRLTTYEVRIQELENLINSFRNSQTEIEAGIINALEELDHIQSSGSSPEITQVTDHVPSEAAGSVQTDFPSEAAQETVAPPAETWESSEIAATEDRTEPEYESEPYREEISVNMESDPLEGDLFSQDPSDADKEEEPTLGIF